ncbi:hypothetical protein CEXT_227791 [Caerostris extrusa]|uniref:Uncharacterized protein n=1 Tax=Caerostris extrusa TaxID=172846 RepID=A0AAV4NK37_CAEEX|nr:hypothetical protein CEXT_227791 [Caerostris extrusa]
MTPETASLAISAKRIASKKCLVTDLEVVENLGVISAICCGKKDVITQNIPTVHYLWLTRRVASQAIIKRKWAKVYFILTSET